MINTQYLQFITENGKQLGSVKEKYRRFVKGILRFDRYFSTKTTGYVSESDFAREANLHPENFAETDNIRFGVKYRASMTSAIESGLRAIKPILQRYSIDPAETSFFDLGSGEGKPLILACESEVLDFNFKRVTGIDYFKPLLETARENIKKLGLEKSITLRFNDIAKFTEYDKISTIFLYNPAGIPVLRKVEENLRKHTESCVVIYNKPLHRDLFSKRNGWNIELNRTHTDPDERLVVLSRINESKD